MATRTLTPREGAAGRAALINALERAGARFSGSGNECRCPFHEDRRASAGIYESPDGAWRFKCHATECGFCGDVYDCLEKAGLGGFPKAERRTEPTPPPPKPTVPQNVPESFLRSLRFVPENVFLYRDPDSRCVRLVVARGRTEEGGKTFRQGHFDGVQWVWKAPPKPWPLYALERIAGERAVVVVEGEKAAEALLDLGIPATTSPGGAGKARYADWSPLAGRTRVVLWPDHDESGRSHMDEVRGLLQALSDPPADVRTVDSSALDLPAKGDAADVVAAAQSQGDDANARVTEILKAARGTRPVDALRRRMDAIESGEYTPIAWPFVKLSSLTRALLPGTLTLLAGNPGGGKSWFSLQCAWTWIRDGVRVAVYELEEDLPWHMGRALTQIAGDARYEDAAFLRTHRARADAVLEENAELMNSLGRAIRTAPDSEITHEHLLAWIEHECRAGAEILIIDPITVASPTREPWAADQRFILRAVQIVRAHGARLLCVTHPKKGSMGHSLDDLAGGAAYQRLSQTILWLKSKPEPEVIEVRGTMGCTRAEVNREVLIAKARNGSGSGLSIGFDFDKESLRFVEVGLMPGKRKKKD